MKTPLHSILLVFLASFIGSFGAVLLKSGAERLKFTVQALLTNWHLLGGVCLFLLSSVFFLMGVRDGELTILYPMVSLGYVWTMLWSKLFFGEQATRSKFLGVALILLGVVLLGLGGRAG